MFFKELKLAAFDPALAGFTPVALHYALMALVSVTVVGAFDAVGSILVVALMIAPATTAWLLTDRLGAMVASIVGAIATMTGVAFVVALITAAARAGGAAPPPGHPAIDVRAAAPAHPWSRKRAWKGFP